MEVSAVSRVDNGHGGYFAGVLGGSLYIVSHHDDVSVVAYHEYGVFQGLSLCGARGFGVAEAYYSRSQPVGGGLETELRSRGRLKEQRGYHFAFQ